MAAHEQAVVPSAEDRRASNAVTASAVGLFLVGALVFLQDLRAGASVLGPLNSFAAPG